MIKIHILHAGIAHKSPYFYNFCKELEKFDDFSYVIDPNLPNTRPEGNGIIYFNRLKRYYDSYDISSAQTFLESIDNLKNMGWKIVFTLHNFFPIDRDITKIDEYVTSEFIKKCDIVFTLSEFMKKSIEKNYSISVINHGMGFNKLDGDFDNKLLKDFQIDNHKFTFTFVGNIYKYKMLDKVIDAINALDGCQLIIGGIEPKNSGVNLQSLIEGNEKITYIPGFIGESDWKTMANITDAFINIYDLNYPQFKYGFFPSNFINIYNTGIQCISPSHEIIRELMPDEQMIYYDQSDTSGLINAMRYAINRGKIKVENNTLKMYDWEKMMLVFLENCRKLFEV